MITFILTLPLGPPYSDILQVPGREQFVHVIFAPQTWSGYEETYFPGIVITKMFTGKHQPVLMELRSP